VVRPTLKGDSATSLMLVSIAADMDMLSSVLSEFPGKHPDAWQSPEWAKDLKDLGLMCERLRQRARELEEIAERLQSASVSRRAGTNG
jgi:hypothetical protein